MANPPANLYYATRRGKSPDDLALWDEVKRIFERFERTAFAEEIKAVFENLQDDELLEALERTRWTGRKGYPIKVMWRTLIASYVLNIPTIQGLIKFLRSPSNTFTALLCGISSEEEIPSRFAYYRFIKKLLNFRGLIERCMAKTIKALRKKLPSFMEKVAIDSTDIPTYSNRFKKPPSDKEAEWGVRIKGGREKEKYFGYKMHIIVEVNYRIPLMIEVTPANVNDSPIMIPLMNKAKSLIQDFKPEYTIADSGYDAYENFKAIVENFKSIPVIELNLRGLKGKPPRFEDIADEYGTPYCAWGIPMVFWGYDKRQKRLKYRCPWACGKGGCTWLEKCSKSKYGHVVKIRLKDDYRRFIQVPRHTKRWQKLYNKGRSSIESIFSVLKKDGEGKMVNHRLRGLSKITLNCLLAVWCYQAKRLAETFKI